MRLIFSFCSQVRLPLALNLAFAVSAMAAEPSDDLNVAAEVFGNFSGGLLEAGRQPEDLATSEHDPRDEFGIQAIEMHLDVDLNDRISGGIYGFAYADSDWDWQAELEEAYLHLHLGDRIRIGGGQFLNVFGFQADRHLHAWDFVNQNLPNGRMLNEGELVTQGGEVILLLSDSDELTIGGGAVRRHSHDHDHDGHGDHEEHHLEADEADFDGWVVSADYKRRLRWDDSIRLSASLATGENGFGRQTSVIGAGVEKLWGGHDHADGELCHGALKWRGEVIGRRMEVLHEDGDPETFDDYGFSSGLFYGLSDRTVLSLRYDWISAVGEMELEERHRISPALSTFLDRDERVQARLQYDYNRSDSLGDDHSVWLQFQVRLGGDSGHQH